MRELRGEDSQSFSKYCYVIKMLTGAQISKESESAFLPGMCTYTRNLESGLYTIHGVLTYTVIQ